MAQKFEHSGARAALLVATANYSDTGLNRLRAPAQDAADMAVVLADPQIGGFAVSQVSDQADHEIKRAVLGFLANRSVEDLVVVYLSCHGVQDAYGRLYFAATNTAKNELKATAVESAWLLDVLDECRARRQVLILDCCFSGAFARTKSHTEIELERRFATHGRGRIVLTASRAEEYSYEGEPLTPGAAAVSMFTAGLVDGLSTGAADHDDDGLISVADAFRQAAEHVRLHRGTQSPQLWIYGGEGSIVLARNPHARTAAPDTLPELLKLPLDSPYPGIRAAAVVAIADLLYSDDPVQRVTARSTLQGVANHDAPAVAAVAQEFLETTRNLSALQPVQDYTGLGLSEPAPALDTAFSATPHSIDIALADAGVIAATSPEMPREAPSRFSIPSGERVPPVSTGDNQPAESHSPPRLARRPTAHLGTGRLRMVLKGTAAVVVAMVTAVGITSAGREIWTDLLHPTGNIALPFPQPLLPQTIAVDGSGAVYVADAQTKRILRLAAGSRTPTALPFNGLNDVSGMTVAPSGDVYVPDYQKGQVLKWTAGTPRPRVVWDNLPHLLDIAVDPSGTLHILQGIPDSPGKPPDAFGVAAYALQPYRMLRLSKDHGKQAQTIQLDPDRPTAMAADTSGDIYLAEGDRVLRFPQESNIGTPMWSTGLQGVYGMTVTRDGIYVTDQQNKRVLRMSEGATPVVLPFKDLTVPRGVAVDTSGHVYVANISPDRKSGTVLKSIGTM